MGISTGLWRMRIGSFTQPDKRVSRIKTLVIGKSSFSLVLRLILALCFLLTVCGDVEVNPGPATGKSTITERQSKLSVSSSGDVRVTRQSVNNDSTVDRHDATDINQTLEQMLQEMSKMNNNLATLNGKVDILNSTCLDLKTATDDLKNVTDNLKSETVDLKAENQSLRSKVDSLEHQLDRIESQSRRNNLIFNGIEGPPNENWVTCENKVRSFLQDTLDMPGSDSVDIERAHRLSSHNSKPNQPVIVKFSSYKDKESVLRKAREKLNRDSAFRVSEDYTKKIRDTRKRLIPFLHDAKAKGDFAVLKYDKLVINNNIFIYDDENQVLKQVGGSKQDTRGAQHSSGRGSGRGRNQRIQSVRSRGTRGATYNVGTAGDASSDNESTL